MNLVEWPLTTVEGWKRKVCEFSIMSDDTFVPVISKGFDVVSAILKDSEHHLIKRALESLDFERSHYLRYENNEESSIRSLMCGLIESVHLALNHLTERSHSGSSKEIRKQIIEVPTQYSMDSIPIPHNGHHLNSDDSFNRLPTVPNFIHSFPLESKEEPIDVSQENLDYYGGTAQDFMGDEVTFKEEDDMNGEIVDNTSRDLMAEDLIDGEGEEMDARYHSVQMIKDSSETIEAVKRRRLSRDERSLKYIESNEESDGEDKSFKKKKRSESVRRKSSKSDSATSKGRISKRSDTEMECPECEFRTKTVSTWINHLWKKHSTTPSMAGLVLRCECGHECASRNHSSQCNAANFTVIRKEYVKVENPQCVLCEMYPKTAKGYILHLYKHHNASLSANGIYLLCSCGFKIIYDGGSYRVHNKNCDERQFTVHKLDEK